MDSGCIVLSLCIEIYASGVVLVRVCILCAPIVGILRFFFSPRAPAVFLREGYAGYATPCRVFAVLLITSFLSSVKKLEFLLFDVGAGTFLKCWVYVHCARQSS
jgi:hypothetical protein